MPILSTKLTLLFACIILLVLQHLTEAFCVYNFSDEGTPPITISNLDKKSNSFHRTLSPGENACCHWSNKACNPEGGRRESYVSFKVESQFNYFVTSPSPTVYCKAGGSLAFRGSKWDDFRYVCTQPDGDEVFSYVKDMSEG